MAHTPKADGPTERSPAAVESSKTLDRGIRLLELLATPHTAGGLTITELASGLMVGRPVVYRLVATLQQHGLVHRGESGRVRLGGGLARLAAGVVPAIEAQARPVLRRLAEACGATAHLTVAEGEQALALVVVEPSWTDVHVAYRSGARHPLTQGAAGRAILAGREGRYGVVATDGELQSGAHGLAVPLHGLTDENGGGVVEGLGHVGFMDASVGVVSFKPLAAEVGPRLILAARQMVELMS